MNKSNVMRIKKIVEKGTNLKNYFPNIAEEWDYESNHTKPEEYTPFSGQKVFWKCSKGHRWKARIADRARGNRCPYCSGRRAVIGENDLKTLFPKICLDWDYEKNEKNPEEFKAQSREKVYWKCNKCGERWVAYIYSRTGKNKVGCPFCAGQRVIVGKNDLASQCPSLLKEWDFEKNNISPNEIAKASGKKVWWICEKGHRWYVSPNSRITNHTGCAKCSSELRTSFGEQAILYYFKKIGIDVESRKKLNIGMELDVYVPEYKFAVEYDGLYYHSGKDAENRELRKNCYCDENEITLIHVKECKSIKNNTEKIIWRNIKDGDKSLDIVIRKVIRRFLILSKIEKNVTVDVSGDRQEIFGQYLCYKKDDCNPKRKSIFLDWNYDKNGKLKPEMFSTGSHKKVWWKCQLNHEYQMAIYHKAEGGGCPFCSNKRILVGFNDLQTRRPDMVRQWDYSNNLLLEPTMFTQNSGKKVYWVCSKGHSYLMSINHKSQGQGCPYCSNKRVMKGYNDLQTLRPDLAKEWLLDESHPNYSPADVVLGCNDRVLWKCSFCGNQWYNSVNNRACRNQGCSVCKKSQRRE